MNSDQAKSIMRDLDLLQQELAGILSKVYPSLKYHSITGLEDYGDFIRISFVQYSDLGYDYNFCYDVLYEAFDNLDRFKEWVAEKEREIEEEIAQYAKKYELQDKQIRRETYLSLKEEFENEQ